MKKNKDVEAEAMERFGTFDSRKLKKIRAEKLVAEQLAEEIPDFYYEVEVDSYRGEYGLRTDLRPRSLIYILAEEDIESPNNLKKRILTSWIQVVERTLIDLKTTLKDLEGGDKMKAKAKNMPAKSKVATTAKKMTVKNPSKPSKMSASKMKKC